MKYLGQISGLGSLRSDEWPERAVEYEFDAFHSKQGTLLASGELRATHGTLDDFVGRKNLQVLTEDGRLLGVQFDEKVQASAGARQVDVVTKDLAVSDWHH